VAHVSGRWVTQHTWRLCDKHLPGAPAGPANTQVMYVLLATHCLVFDASSGTLQCMHVVLLFLYCLTNKLGFDRHGIYLAAMHVGAWYCFCC
jgi:hypothetical protein